MNNKMETIIKKGQINALQDLEILLLKAELENNIVPDFVYYIIHKLRTGYEKDSNK